MHVIYTSPDLRQNQFVLFILQLYDLTCTSINVNITSILNIQFGNLFFFINNCESNVKDWNYLSSVHSIKESPCTVCTRTYLKKI